MKTTGRDCLKAMDIDQILDDFEFLDDWEDRYRYVIELGKALPDFPETLKTSDTKVEGCASQVWLKSDRDSPDGDNPLLTFSGDSDALIVRGLIAILFAVYSGRPARDILETDAEAILKKLGLEDHLTKQRSNGLHAMVGRIRSDARLALRAAA